MSGVNKLINGELTMEKKSGSALRSALGSVFSPSAIANKKDDKVSIKMPGK